MKLVVDANVFISALIGGKAAKLLFNPNFSLLTTERTTWEVKKYLPQLASYSEKSPTQLLYLFELIPVRACQSKEYDCACPVAPADSTGVCLWLINKIIAFVLSIFRIFVIIFYKSSESC